MRNEITELLCPNAKDDAPRVLHYDLLREIGRGGMGIVFEARDLRLDRKVALKVLSPTIAARTLERERFIQEARAAASVKHPNVVTIHAVETSQPLPFLVMELLEGESLASRLSRDERMNIRESLPIARQLADGLQAAHQVGLLHRDIKPANIWLETSGSLADTNCRVKLLDFGLAEPLHSLAASGSGGFAGTPAYVSPEQARSEPLDNRSDIYSLGTVFYRMISGKLPFPVEARSLMLASIATRSVPGLEGHRSDLPASLSQLVDQMVEHSPEDRPRSVAEVASRLDQVHSEVRAGWVGRIATMIRTREFLASSCALVLPAIMIWSGMSAIASPKLKSKQAVVSKSDGGSNLDTLEGHKTKVVVCNEASGLASVRPVRVLGEPDIQAAVVEFDLSVLQEQVLVDAGLHLPASLLSNAASEICESAVWVIVDPLGLANGSCDLEKLFSDGKIRELASGDSLNRIMNGVSSNSEFAAISTRLLAQVVDARKGSRLQIIIEAENVIGAVDWHSGTSLLLEVTDNRSERNE